MSGCFGVIDGPPPRLFGAHADILARILGGVIRQAIGFLGVISTLTAMVSAPPSICETVPSVIFSPSLPIHFLARFPTSLGPCNAPLPRCPPLARGNASFDPLTVAFV